MGFKAPSEFNKYKYLTMSVDLHTNNDLDNPVSLEISYTRRPLNVIPGKDITKEVRQMVHGVSEVNGKNSMKPENAQRKAIEDGTGVPCLKSNHLRIHEETLEMTKKSRPYSGKDADIQWTEDFDGYQSFMDGKCRILYNFKSIAGSGGSQTRSLRCVYHFVKVQQKLIHSGNLDKNTYFVNILDGEECEKKMHLFDKFANEDQIYMGDMYGYFSWLNKKLQTIL